jgi:lipid-A-disaccharide synthase-like uncharacterized protein
VSAAFWQWIGCTGTVLFGARWVLQALAWRRRGGRRAAVGRSLWLVSLASSVALVAYFTAGPYRAAVGVLGTLFPLMVAAYDLAHATRRPRIVPLRRLVLRARGLRVQPAAPRVTDRRWPVAIGG